MTFSLNNRLVLETYVKKSLEAKVQGGIATPNQKDGVKGLRVLVEATLNDGRRIPVGSTIISARKPSTNKLGLIPPFLVIPFPASSS